MAAPPLEHPRQQRASELNRCTQVHVEGAVDLVMVKVLDPPARGKGGVRHQHVDRSRGLGESSGAVPVGEIGHQHLCASPEARRKLVEGVAAAAAQQHLRAALV